MSEDSNDEGFQTRMMTLTEPCFTSDPIAVMFYISWNVWIVVFIFEATSIVSYYFQHFKQFMCFTFRQTWDFGCLCRP